MSETPQAPPFTGLITVKELSVALQMGESGLEGTDSYALMIVEHASNAVRDYARKQGWVRNLSDPAIAGEEVAPATAREITTWVAVRAYTNPRNLSRRGSGPISESFENGLWALELTPSEKERIDRITGGGSSGDGLWILPIDGGFTRRRREIRVPIEPQPGSPFPIADEGQYPYNAPHDGYGTLVGDVEYQP